MSNSKVYDDSAEKKKVTIENISKKKNFSVYSKTDESINDKLVLI